MEDQGYVKLYRKAMNGGVFSRAKTWKVWCWVLGKANFKETKFQFNGEDIILQPGQFITGRSNACIELEDITAQEFRTIIKYLKSTNRITTKVTNRFTVVTVQKWDRYQSDNQPTNKPLTSHQPATNHIQECKNDKKESDTSPYKELKYLLGVPEGDLTFLTVGLNITASQVKDKAEDLYNYCKAKGKVYKDYRAFLRNSLKRDFPKDTSYRI